MTSTTVPFRKREALDVHQDRTLQKEEALDVHKDRTLQKEGGL